MANKTHAIEWLQKAYHDLDSANILFESGHYTDTIGYIYHQLIEKIFKSFIAYDNCPIIKTHNLVELNEIIDKKLPKKEEIAKVKEFAIFLFEEVLIKLNIDKKRGNK